jgi:hypothetical protein
MWGKEIGNTRELLKSLLKLDASKIIESKFWGQGK